MTGWQRQNFDLFGYNLRRPETEGEGTAAEGAEGKPAPAAGAAATAAGAGAKATDSASVSSSSAAAAAAAAGKGGSGARNAALLPRPFVGSRRIKRSTERNSHFAKTGSLLGTRPESTEQN